MIEARVLAHSVAENCPPMVTFWRRYPRFIHSEDLRHRASSFSASGSRAVPVSKNLQETRSDELRAAPIWWGREQRGMQSGEELDDECPELSWPYCLPSILRHVAMVFFPEPDHEMITEMEYAKRLWRLGSLFDADVAEEMSRVGVHKSIVNRRIESSIHITTIQTICGPGLMNFFGLRLDKAAQAEMRALAEAMWRAYQESVPKTLRPGEWHLPFVDEETEKQIAAAYPGSYLIDPRPDVNQWKVDTRRKVSAARCARTSYDSFETRRRSTVKEDVALCDRLIASRHWSPLEHQATPDIFDEFQFIWVGDRPPTPNEIATKEPADFSWVIRGTESGNRWLRVPRWKRQDLHGNLLGWCQWRKTFPGEAVTPLPEGYAT